MGVRASISESGRPIETPEARYGQTGQGVYLAPGPTGAHNWPPMAWNQETGLVYMPAKNNNFFYAMTESLEYHEGRLEHGDDLPRG